MELTVSEENKTRELAEIILAELQEAYPSLQFKHLPRLDTATGLSTYWNNEPSVEAPPGIKKYTLAGDYIALCSKESRKRKIGKKYYLFGPPIEVEEICDILTVVVCFAHHWISVLDPALLDICQRAAKTLTEKHKKLTGKECIREIMIDYPGALSKDKPTSLVITARDEQKLLSA